jgi:purine-binding chemotaxis protein CheW
VEHSNRQVLHCKRQESPVEPPILDIVASDTGRILLVFQLSDRLAALRLEDIERITLMAELATPPGLPSALVGILNLGGIAIPVLRLDRLFGLPTQRLGLYSMLVILKASGEGRSAILADRVTEVLTVSENEFLPVDSEDAFNGCVEATVMARDGIVHLLSPNRMLLAKERATLSEFLAVAQQRLQDWKGIEA